MTTTIGSTPHLLGDDTNVVTSELWAISAVRKQDSKNPLHVFLSIQGKNEWNQDLLYRAHLVIDTDSGGIKTISGEQKKAKVMVDDYSEALKTTPEAVDAYFKNCVHRTTWVTAAKGKEILQIANDDQKNEIYYSLIDSDIKKLSIQVGASRQTQNCASWAESVLSRAKVELISSGWLGVFLVHPKVLVPDDKKDATSGQCVTQ